MKSCSLFAVAISCFFFLTNNTQGTCIIHHSCNSIQEKGKYNIKDSSVILLVNNHINECFDFSTFTFDGVVENLWSQVEKHEN